MLLHYSPYFNGHTYINYSAHTEHHGGLMGETIESTEGLLARLELMSGMAYPEQTDDLQQQRALEYCQVLQQAVSPGHQLHTSIHNDQIDKDNPSKSRCNVSAELLRWRDTLILAGWNRQDPLPGKLSAISDAESHIPAHSTVLRGTADRWYNLTSHSSLLTSHSSHITIQVHLPQVLVEPLIHHIIDLINPAAPANSSLLTPHSSLKTPHSSLLTPHSSLLTPHLSILTFSELYQAYEWLTQQPPTPGQVIVCSDSERLDSVLRCHSLPTTTGDAAQGCHHVISDVRSYLDTPDSLIWLDCNGDYGFHYPYDFISTAEKAGLAQLGIQIPDEQTMLSAIHSHIEQQLSQVPSVTLISSAYDTATPLQQHPMVASALICSGVKAQQGTYSINTQSATEQPKFTPALHYDITDTSGNPLPVNVGQNIRMSYSALTQLIQHPFNHILERHLQLKEPYSKEDIRSEKGNVAHRLVRFLVNYNPTGLNATTATFNTYFHDALTLLDDHTTPYSSILLDDENRFELDNLKATLHESLTALRDIITTNGLTIVGSEVEIPYGQDNRPNPVTVHLSTFGPSVAKIDMILKDKKGQYYIFDFKNSESQHYEKMLAENKSLQFAFYEEIFKNYYREGTHNDQPNSSLLTPHSSPLTLIGIGYYLFPLHTLYTPAGHSGHLHGKNVEIVDVDTTKVNDILDAMHKSYDFRITQFQQGHIEEGEGQTLDTAYTDQCTNPANTLFPLDVKSGLKAGPYTPNHLVLKNQLR